jgi:methionyl-tRNA formyltransferase
VRVVFMGKSKRSAVRALDLLAERGADVAGVVAAEPDRWARAAQRLDLAARRHGLPLLREAELYDAAPGGVDLVISFLYPRLIREPLLSLGRVGCLNFHPAPLPDFRGLGGYNVAILEGLREWGVSCHFVDEHFDTGDLVEVERFPIDPDAHTAFSLDLESGERLVGLFSRVMDRALAGEELPREPQGDGRYISREEFERLRVVRPGDDLDRKLRAFWYPPYPGAVLEVDGRRLTLVDDTLLAEVAGVYRDAGRLP